MSHEEKLTGGNVSTVYRSGNTVRRQLKPESARIHKLLNHLEKKGFQHSPAFLGIDEKGREILSFIDGEAGNYPLKEYMWSDEVLSGIAKMLRHYHDAVSDFPIAVGWEPIDLTPESYEVLCHNDFAIYNIIFNKQQPVGIIDFDVAGPGPRRWDIAYTLYTCVPLSRVRYSETGEAMHYERERDAERIKERVKRFFESYGIDVGMEDLQMVIRRLEAICQTIHRKAREGDPAFQKMIEEGHVEHYQKDIAFVRENLNDWIEEA